MRSHCRAALWELGRFFQRIDHCNASGVRTTVNRGIADGVLEKGPDGKLRFANPFFQEWLKTLPFVIEPKNDSVCLE